ncbi:sel1 repeat family protein [Massilia sp. R2A-15]|uniref:sel1 repeat family protein n=1 Tax=Massilia sp. R2A-15 TaxID=3064278 RepID=UPI0027342CC6|nr:sel1 repeat family protein [Massilia sp. R2A-15]WLI87737.1 sel1 repeat family protein [Massilia sp. R2A-15]
MKRFIAGVFLIAGAATACAADLSDAAKALNGKDYRQALALYTQLANAGNPEAELRLGEMYWYGEGAPLDREKGDALFAKAAAAGHPGAVAATRLTGQRQQRLADISYWTTGYDGADLVAGEFNCVQPKAPDVSRTKSEIGKVSAAFEAYRACYNGFISNLESVLPPAKRIPEDIALLMSEQELGQAREHLGKVYAAVAEHGKQTAAQVMASREAWMLQTTAYLTTESNRWEQRMADMDRYRRDHAIWRDWTIRNAPAVTIPK